MNSASSSFICHFGRLTVSGKEEKQDQRVVGKVQIKSQESQEPGECSYTRGGGEENQFWEWLGSS
jgi:hypothetical protein